MNGGRTFRICFRLILPLCWTIALVSPVLADTSYTITDLSTPGELSSQAEMINEKGQVIGNLSTENHQSRAFLWSQQAGMLDLGALGGNSAEAYGINAAGQSVGTAETALGDFHPFLWGGAEDMQDLGTLGGDEGLAWSINSAGQVCGESKTTLGKTHAFLWDSGASTPRKDLGTLGGSDSVAYEINNLGQVAGDAQYSAGDYYHAFLWSKTNGIQDLGTLGGPESTVWDLNDNGQIVGGADVSAYSCHAFLWQKVGGMQDLGTLCGGMDEAASEARAINRFGQVAGWSQDCDYHYRAFRWDAENGMQDLGSLGGNYAVAYSINDCGQIVGEAAISDWPFILHAFMWDKDNGMKDLGVLGGPYSSSSAFHVNSLGQAVGYASGEDDSLHAAMFSPPPVLTLVIKYYRDILRRCSDANGAGFWFDSINSLVSLGVGIHEGFLALSKNFLNSPEYLSYGRSNVAYLEDLYRTFFDRDPDAAGLAYWLAMLQQGITRNGAVIEFVNSNEFTDYLAAIFGNVVVRPEFNLVNDFYRGLLARFPEEGGFAFWLGQMQQAQCTGSQAVREVSRQLAHLFAGSSEYVKRNRTNELFVEDLYDAILRRGQDLAGFTYWTEQLNSGLMTRAEVLDAFVDSGEFQGRVEKVIAAGCL